jgi:N utilization substance protein B
LALKVLFQVDVGRADPARALDYTAELQRLMGDGEEEAARTGHTGRGGHTGHTGGLGVSADLTPEDVAFAGELVRGALDHLPEIDQIIVDHAREWRIERMANIDRNVLRLALYEMAHRPDIPVSVSINEAVELAKKFGTGESGRFVNGILGNAARLLKRDE